MRPRFSILESASALLFGGGNPAYLVLVGALCAFLWWGTRVSAAEGVDTILRQIKSQSTQGLDPQPEPQAATVNGLTSRNLANRRPANQDRRLSSVQSGDRRKNFPSRFADTGWPAALSLLASSMATFFSRPKPTT